MKYDKTARKYLWFEYEEKNINLVPIYNVLHKLTVLVVICIGASSNLFAEIRGSNFLNKRKFLNAIVLFQYVPRVLRIYLSWRKLNSNDNNLARIVWVKPAFNFFLYILASHVSWIFNSLVFPFTKIFSMSVWLI